MHLNFSRISSSRSLSQGKRYFFHLLLLCGPQLLWAPVAEGHLQKSDLEQPKDHQQEHLQQQPQTGSDRVSALTDSGTARLDRGDIESARTLFDQALRLDSNYPDAVLGMGRIYLENDAGAERALEYLRRATALMPINPETHYYRALAHVRMAKTDLGRDNAQMARRELGLTLDLNPSHYDAYYQLGDLLKEVYEDYPGAEEAFSKQIAVNPEHSFARMDLLKTRIDLGLWDNAVETAEEILSRDPSAAEAYPYLAAAHWRGGRPDESMRVFERYFGMLDEDERNLYLDMGAILTPREREEFLSLDESGRRSFRAHYWGTRDPDPKTATNERLLEHFIRIAYARIEFGKQDWPWDPRGDFYVRYGPPDIRTGRGRPFAAELIDDDVEFVLNRREFEVSMGLSPEAIADISGTDVSTTTRAGFVDASNESSGSGAAITTVGRDPERWIYPDRGIDIVFEDPIGRGHYLVASDKHRLLVTQMETLLPTVSVEEEKIEIIDPMDSVVTFKGSDGKTLLEYAFALLPDEFGAFRSVTGSYATIDVDVNLYSENWELVAETSEKARRLRTIPQIQINGIPLFVDATRMEVEPGTYRLTTMLLDPETGKRATAEEVVDLPDYSGSDLMVSSILPAAMITQVAPGRTGTFIRNDLEVLPLPGRVLQADQPLFIYYEIYNLTKDQFGGTDYEVAYSVAEAPQDRALATRLFQGLASLVGAGRKRAVITSSVTGSGISSDVYTYLEIDISGLPPMTYEITLTVTDTLTGESATSVLLFRTLPAR